MNNQTMTQILNCRTAVQVQGNNLEYYSRNAKTTCFGGAITRQMLEHQEERKSTAVTYVLWGFLGAFGAHRFYLGETGTAVAQLILGIYIPK